MNSRCMCSLFSCFGPFGRTKIIANAAGEVTLNRDGAEILSAVWSAQSNEVLDSYFTRYCQRRILEFASSSGDGCKTLLFIQNNIEQSILNIASSNSTRIHLLRAFEIIQRVSHAIRNELTDILVQSQVWQEEKDLSRFIHKICLNIAVPVVSIDHANMISETMVNWVVGDTSPKMVVGNCGEIIQHFDQLTFCVNDTAQNLQLPTHQPYHILPMDSIALEGRSDDLLSWFDKNNSYCLYCVETFFECIETSTDDNFTLNNNFEAANISGISGSCQTLELLVTKLVECGSATGHVVVLLCASQICVLHREICRLHNVRVVYDVDEFYLRLIAQRFTISIWSSIPELWSDFESKENSKCNNSNSIRSERSLSLSHMDIIRRSKGVKNLFLIIGVAEMKGKVVSCTAQKCANFTRQVFLTRTENKELNRSLLKRCVNAIAFSISRVTVRTALTSEFVLVPGAGVAEAVWSTLWESVALHISKETTDGKVTFVHSNLARAVELVSRPISDHLVSIQLRRAAAHACTIIATSYEIIPYLLRNNTKFSSNLSPKSSVVRSEVSTGFDKFHAVLLSSTLDVVFKDPIDLGVCGSVDHFWSGYFLLLDLSIMQLRLNGNDGVLRAKQVKLK